MKKVLKIIRSIIVSIIVIVISYAILGNLSAQNITLYNIVNYRNYVVLTGSMEPSISPGDYITVRKVNPDKLKENDVITFMLDGVVVTHKVVKVEGDLITTQGTANNIADEPINKSSVIAKYVFKLAKVGYIMAFFSSKSGLILIFGLIGVMIFWDLTDPERNKKTDETTTSKRQRNSSKKKTLELSDTNEATNSENESEHKIDVIREVILENLNELGKVSKELKGKINAEQDLEKLKALSKKSARVDSVEEFMEYFLESEVNRSKVTEAQVKEEMKEAKEEVKKEIKETKEENNEIKQENKEVKEEIKEEIIDKDTDTDTEEIDPWSVPKNQRRSKRK